MNDFTRRTFLSTTASWGVAWPLIQAFDLAWQPSQLRPEPRPLVTFDEPGFPVVDAAPPRAVPGARATASVAELTEALQPDSILVWRHGSAFPADGWAAVLKFLDAGGALLHAGGEPWTRPVSGAAGSRRVEPRTLAHLQALRLNQSYRVDAGSATLRRAGVSNPAARTLPGGAWVAVL